MRPLRVEEERWRAAQAWELAFWQRAQQRSGWRALGIAALRPLLRVAGHRVATGDDWNEWWREQFDAYRFLSAHLGDYIELGCGPYTNTRLILDGRTATRVVCSDPLADEYVEFRDAWLSHAARRGAVEIDAHPIEELPFSPSSFDTVVLINVLDHVRDLALCLDTAIALLRPNGTFVFGQDLASEETIGEYGWYEQGHPIRVTLGDVRPFLDRLTPVYDHLLPPRDPRVQSAVIAFAGRRMDTGP